MFENENKYNELRKLIIDSGYKFNDSAYNYNLLGIRNKKGMLNTFSDTMYLVWKDVSKRVMSMACTTSPGVTYLINPENSKGTAILKPGQYLNLWKLGYHRGKYEALVQNSECVVYRDSDRDRELDTGTEDKGYFGINYHHAGEHSIEVNNWSAGCQVIANLQEYLTSMYFLKQQQLPIYTYTLCLK